MRTFRIPAIVLSIVLQIAPVCKNVWLNPSAQSAFAIIFRWAAGGAIAAGTMDAVSGASAMFTSKTNALGTNGLPFKFIITLANIGSDSGTTFAAVPLPAGLTVSNHGTVPIHGVIQGTPTQTTNNMKVRLAATFRGSSITTNLYLTILPAEIGPAGPAITTPPTPQVVTAGQTATFTVLASGDALTYQWKKDGNNLNGQTASTLTLNNARMSQVGDYSVGVTNAGGGLVSSSAHLTVNLPAPPQVGLPSATGGQFLFTFSPVVGLTNTVLTSTGALGGWTTWTNIPPPATSDPIQLTDPLSDPAKVYEVQVQP